MYMPAVVAVVTEKILGTLEHKGNEMTRGGVSQYKSDIPLYPILRLPLYLAFNTRFYHYHVPHNPTIVSLVFLKVHSIILCYLLQEQPSNGG